MFSESNYIFDKYKSFLPPIINCYGKRKNLGFIREKKVAKLVVSLFLPSETLKKIFFPRFYLRMTLNESVKAWSFKITKIKA